MNLFKKFWPILFLVGVFIILFYKIFFFGQVFYEGDNFYINIPAKYFLVQQILHGSFPLWNPYLFLGIPYFADFNLGTLNPTNSIYFFLSVPRALTFLTILDFFGLALGMYMLLRGFSLSKTSSLYGAIITSLSGMPFVLLGNMTFMQVIVYIPFLFLITKKFCKEKALLWLLLLTGLQFLQLIAGHPQETYYTMFFILLYLLFFLPSPFWKRIVTIIFYTIFPLLLSSVQLLPFLEYVQNANRQVGNIAYSGWGGLTPSLLPTFLFPTFYGSHVDGTWWGTQQILVGFIGVPTVVFLYIGSRFATFQEKWFILLGFVLSFFLAFGSVIPLFYVFYYLIPGWRLFRAPAGILVFYTFFAAVLASFGLEYVKNHSEKFKKTGKILVLLGFVSALFSAGVYAYANKKGFWKIIFLTLQNHLHKHVFSAILFYDTVKIQQMFQGILWNILFVSIFGLLTGIILYFFSKRKFQTLLLLLITIIGFFIVDPKIIFTAPLNFYNTGKDIPSVLASVKKGQYRILSIPVDLHQQRQHLPSSDFFYREDKADLSIYQYNNNIQRGLYQTAGYVSLVPKSFSNLIGAKDASTNVTNIDFSGVTQRQLNLSNVRYILSHEPIRSFNNIPLTLIAQKLNTHYIYENKSALPRAYVLEDPYGNHVTWKNVRPTNLSFIVTVPKPSHLILSDWYYPGWRALVNGREVPIVPYLKTFQAITIPQGKSKVEFVYEPSSLKIGAIVSAISFGLFGILFILKRKVKL